MCNCKSNCSNKCSNRCSNRYSYSTRCSCQKSYNVNSCSSNYYGNFNCNNNCSPCKFKCSDYLDCFLDSLIDPCCCTINNYYPKSYSYKKPKYNKCKPKRKCKDTSYLIVKDDYKNDKISKYCLKLLTKFSFSSIYKLKLNDIKDNFDMSSDPNALLGINDMLSSSINSEDLSWKISMNGDGTFPFRLAYKSDKLKARIEGIQEAITNTDIFTIEYPENMGLKENLCDNNLDLSKVNGIVIRLSLNEEALTTTVNETTMDCNTTMDVIETTLPETTSNVILPTIILCDLKIKTTQGVHCIPEIRLDLNDSMKKTVGFLLPKVCSEFIIKGDVVIKNSSDTISMGPDVEIIGANIIC